MMVDTADYSTRIKYKIFAENIGFYFTEFYKIVPNDQVQFLIYCLFGDSWEAYSHS
jgi:hypothetical protein